MFFSWRILKDQFQLDKEEGYIVEIDKSKFGRKRKYSKGSTRNQDGKWIFGMVERVWQRVFIFSVADRKRETLQPVITAHIKPGATVHSDKFSTYFNLNELGLDHKTVKHSVEFVNKDGIHTNTIEGFWGNSKQHFKQFRGVTKSLLDPHLDKLMYCWYCKNSLHTFLC